jgi:nitrogen fixation NifU-like protein
MPQQLYQQLIIDHNQAPIGKDKLFCFSHSMDGENPSCGDELTLYFKLCQQQIENIGFNSDACAICTASASLLCEQLQGKNLEQASEMADSLRERLQQKSLPQKNGVINNTEINNALAPLTAVSKYPSRINCALLPWSTLDQLIKGATAP